MKRNIMNVGSTTFMFFALCVTLIVTACGDLENILKALEKNDSLPRVQTDKIKVLRFLGEKDGRDNLHIEVHIPFDKEVVVTSLPFPRINFRIIGSTQMNSSAVYSPFSNSEPKTLVFVYWPKTKAEREETKKGNLIYLDDFSFSYGYIADTEGRRLPEENNIIGGKSFKDIRDKAKKSDIYKLKSVKITSSPKNGNVYAIGERIKIEVTFQEEVHKDHEAELKRSGVALLQADESTLSGKSYLLGEYGYLRLDNGKSNGDKVYNFKYKVQNSPLAITLPEGIPSIDFGTVKCGSSLCRPTISFENEE